MKHFSFAFLALGVGCLSVAVWGAVFGTQPLLPTADGLTWWPGAFYAVPVAAVVFTLLEAWSGSERLVHIVAGSAGQPIWFALAAIALWVLVRLRWEDPMRVMAPLELGALAMAGVALAGLLSIKLGPPPSNRLPAPRFDPTQLPGAGVPRTLAWRASAVARWHGWRGEELHRVAVHIDPQRLHAQVELPHSGAMPDAYVVQSPEIGELAAQLRRISDAKGLDRIDEVCLVLGLVTEGLGAAEGEDRPLYPLEALAAEAPPGLTARLTLAAALLGDLGYQPALLCRGSEYALAVGGEFGVPDLFFSVAGKPALFTALTPDGFYCGDAPAGVRATTWTVLPV